MWEPVDSKIREAIRTITDRFLTRGEATPKFDARVRLGPERNELDVAVKEGYLTDVNNTYLPRMRALELEDNGTRGVVRDYTQHVLLVLRQLYTTGGGRTQFSATDVQKAVGEADSLVPVLGITGVGLHFATDFNKYIASCGISGGLVNHVNVSEGIIDFETIDRAWKAELESRESLAHPPEGSPALISAEGEAGPAWATAKASRLPNKERLLGDIKRFLVSQETISLLFIDLDGFKSVNDTRGHQAGDECLDMVVKVASKATRRKGTIYRYGGDEFCILLPNFDSVEAQATAERIRAAIGASDSADGLKVTASIGVVSSDQIEPRTAEDLVNFADQAMYESKQSGGNGVTLHAVSLAPKQVPPKFTPGDLTRRLDAVEVTISLRQAVPQNYILLVKNDSDEDISVRKVTLERAGLQLCQPAAPKEDTDWSIGPRAGKEIWWSPSPDPVRILQMSQAPPTSPIDLEIIVECEILGTRKEFRRKILVAADYGNHRLDALNTW